jgi:hypothetical protein
MIRPSKKMNIARREKRGRVLQNYLDAVRVERVRPRLESDRKPEPLRPKGVSGSACGAAGRFANGRFCSASLGKTSPSLEH